MLLPDIEVFDPIQYKLNKRVYLTQEAKDAVIAHILPEEEQLAERDSIETHLREAIRAAHEEFEGTEASYPIVGFVLHGSWIHGTADPDSDVDVFPLVTRHGYIDYLRDVKERVRQQGLTKELGFASRIFLEERDGIVRLLENGYKVISPFPEIEENAPGILNEMIAFEKENGYLP